jgi:hypothetical protein
MKLDSNGLEMGFQIGNTLPPPVRLTHEWQDSPEGLQVTSRMFYGLQSFTLSNALLVKFVNYVALKVGRGYRSLGSGTRGEETAEADPRLGAAPAPSACLPACRPAGFRVHTRVAVFVGGGFEHGLW